MLRKVKVENGWVEGLPAADPRITSFKGIPFAAPATGENRWRAPQPDKDWDGVLQCHAFGPIAMQAKPGKNHDDIYTREWNYDENIAQSEDCLQLNVWTPAKSADENLPVFVWYYGGGLQVGNPAEMEFDGERLARRGVVVVTGNYRVNVFGFLCHPEITAENPDAGFIPTSGAIRELNFRSTPNVWGYFSVDSSGRVHEYADSQFGHLFSWGATRNDARRNMVQALREFSIRGDIHTTVDYLLGLIQSDAYIDNQINTDWLDTCIKNNVHEFKPEHLRCSLYCRLLHLHKVPCQQGGVHLLFEERSSSFKGPPRHSS